ncbi:MAG TPA: hypothetical protein PLV45_09855 [bacterium]|nr:hypothetical protein [bacterium]
MIKNAGLLSVAGVIALLPILAVPIIGYDVPTAAQPDFNAPAPPLTRDSAWVQTFIAPDLPVSAVALRPGTYGVTLKGKINGRVGYLTDIESNGPSVRSWHIDLGTVENNRWYICRFPSMDPVPGRPAAIRLSGEDLPGDAAVTFWRNTADAFPDGIFLIDDQIQQGDLSFKVLCRVRGLDILRMIKSRWMENRPGIWKRAAVPILLLVMWFAGYMTLLLRSWKGIRS